MGFTIRMGIPEMLALWTELQTKYRDGTIRKDEEALYKKWGNALKKLSADPAYPGLKTHEIPSLSKRYGVKVWQSYLENKTSKANVLGVWTRSAGNYNHWSGTAPGRR